MSDSGAWQVYKRLLGFARPYRVLLGLAVLGMLVEAGAGSGFLWLMSPITNNLVNPEDINPWMP
ncbi:MAG: lipid ABC transporter permease/ATP-binding protein, partial [Stenotrophomonas sp.]